MQSTGILKNNLNNSISNTFDKYFLLHLSANALVFYSSLVSGRLSFANGL